MRTLALLTPLLLVASATLGAMAKDDKKNNKPSDPEAKKIAWYDKMKAEAQRKCNEKDTEYSKEFADAVEARYEEMMREHSQEAFENNTQQRSRLVTIREDTWREHDKLYDNLMVQDHINRIGQRLVPPGSDKLYAFRVVPNAIPMARALSTGTIYVSTGMISLLQSEAQLAYVLGHELAHVHHNHWRERAMIEVLQEEKDESRQKLASNARTAARFLGPVGGAIGGGAAGAIAGAVIGGSGGHLLGKLLAPKGQHVGWDVAQENHADDMAFDILLKNSYDVNEIRSVYDTLNVAATKDSRVRLGFLGETDRIKTRIDNNNKLLSTHKTTIDERAKSGFKSTSSEHRNLMAELKRDNGILAFYHDMFEMARTNLSEAAAIRDNDPAVHYFYGKTLKLVGRTDEDARLAKEAFERAAKADIRRQNYGANLHLALLVAREKARDPKTVATELDTYVTNFVRWQVENGERASYPPNLDSIYEYISVYGEQKGWRPPKVPKFSELHADALSTNLALSQTTEVPREQPKEMAPETPAAPKLDPGSGRRSRTPQSGAPERTAPPRKSSISGGR